MYKELSDIPMYSNWVSIKQIEEGWSKDRKFYIKDTQGQEFLLRISDIKLYEVKLKEFEMIQKFNTLDFTMSKAIAFGKCSQNQSVYMLLSWVQGESLEKSITGLAEQKQYELGIQAGKVLKKLHSLPISLTDQGQTKQAKDSMLHKLQRYEICEHRIEGDEVAINYVKQNIDKIENAQPVYNHGDFHVGNLILTPDQHIGVIDFNRWKCTSPYEEFYKIQSFDREISIPFARGKINGYFDKQPPAEFWEALAVYNAYAALYSIYWAVPFGEEEVQGMVRRCQLAFEDYNYFNCVIPKWY